MTLHAPDTAIATRLYAAWHFEMHLEQPAIQFKDAFSVHIIDFGIKKKNDLNQLSPGRMNDLQMWIFSRNDADYFSGMPRSVYFF